MMAALLTYVVLVVILSAVGVYVSLRMWGVK